MVWPHETSTIAVHNNHYITFDEGIVFWDACLHAYDKLYNWPMKLRCQQYAKFSSMKISFPTGIINTTRNIVPVKISAYTVV